MIQQVIKGQRPQIATSIS